MDEMMVSVLCMTYNHVGLIAKALDGFVMQKTSFCFEVLVHDDASTDGTIDILKSYETKYPDILKILYEKENQYSKGNNIFQIMRPLAHGKYIAICEGDDYWTDAHKLQKQVDFMETHSDVMLCCHSASEHNLKTDRKYVIPAGKTESYYPSMEEIIERGGGYFPTCSFMVRSDLEIIPDRWGKGICGDFRRILHARLKGRVFFMNDNMAVHTYLYPGSWSSTHEEDQEKMRAFRTAELEAMASFNQDTDYQYDQAVQYRIHRTQIAIEYGLNQNYKKIFSKEYKEARKVLSFKMRIIVWLRAFMPFVYAGGHWIKSKFNRVKNKKDGLSQS